MKTTLLIHGYNGIPKIFDYFKAELEKLNYNVIMPGLPSQEKISFGTWEERLRTLDLPTEITALIAHSIGNEFMIRYCAKNHLRIRTYIGLAGFVESFTHEGRDDLNAVIVNMQCTKSDIDEFISLTSRRYAIYSNDDHIVPYGILENFPVTISAEPILIPHIGHMGKKSGLEQLPEVIKLIKETTK